jgi:hypothetical protein
MLRRLVAATLAAGIVLSAMPATAAIPVGTGWPGTNRGDDSRSAWYPSSTAPTPWSVADNYGTLFDVDLGAMVHAQPVVAGGNLIVATEADVVAGLDPATGEVRWTRTLGVPVDAATDGCEDISPVRGVTSTPVVDPSSGDVFVVDEEQRRGHTAFMVHRIDPTTGAERSGFPVKVAGMADNQPGVRFVGDAEMQRPGLLLLDGVVYAAFASHCDQHPYNGWVAGISTAGHVTTLFAAEPGSTGEGGIWQSGAGLSSDGPGQILVTTGNGPGMRPGTPGRQPGHRLGSAAIRLEVSGSGRLVATDFFEPYDQAYLSDADADFGSGGLVALPGAMGTPLRPRLALTGSKAGWLYLLDRGGLGGASTGPNGSDAVVDRINLGAKILSTPSVSPDDGLIFVSTTGVGYQRQLVALRLDRTGLLPRLVVVGTSTPDLGFGSGSASISTKTGFPGTSLVWLVRCGTVPGPSCSDASLDVYGATPVDGHLTEVASWPISRGAKFAQPLIWNRAVFVATAHGVMAVGRRPDPPIGATTTLVPSAPAVPVGSAATGTLTITAPEPVTVSSLAFSSPAVSVDAAALDAAKATPSTTFELPLTVDTSLLAPQGEATSAVTIATSGGTTTLPLVVHLTAPGPLLMEVRPAPFLSFGGVARGANRVLTGTLTNIGRSDLTITGVTALTSPFSFSWDPLVGRVVAPGASLTYAVVASGVGRRGIHTANATITTTGGSMVLHLVATVARP